MNSLVNRIAASAGIFLGVLLIMCLAARIMMDRDASEAAGDSQEMSVSAEALAPADGKQSAGSSESVREDDSVTVEETIPGDETGMPDESDSETQSDTSEQPGESVQPDEPIQSDEVKSHVVVIDAAHQIKANTETEPIGPGASDTRYKVTSGASGVATGTPEYKLNLAIALLLEEELTSRGYEVVMVRSVDEVDISDSERAKFANSSGEIVIHLHGNADDREGIDGTMAYAPSKDNPYLDADLIKSCETLSKALLSGLNSETGANTWNVIYTDNLTALNWTSIPASHVEVGFLSNKAEDALLQTDEYRRQIATGLADGCDLYFGAGEANR